MQVSARPNKVWLFDLRNDPLEKRNIAEQLGVRSIEDLEALSSASTNQWQSVAAAEIEAGHHAVLVKIFKSLQQVDSQQSKPLWPALVEVPIRIDKTSNSIEEEGDEVVFWAN
jgi:hypothetical protein